MYMGVEYGDMHAGCVVRGKRIILKQCGVRPSVRLSRRQSRLDG